MSYLKIKSPDPKILDRITETEVAEWMAAKLCQLNEIVPVHVMDVNVWKRKYGGREPEEYCDVQWNMHAPGAISNGPMISGVISEIKKILSRDPRKQASEKRWQAASLIQEAETLEATAKKLGV